MGQMKKETIPNLYGAIVLIFPEETSKARIMDILHEHIDYQTCENSIEVIYREIKEFYSWEVDELITALFDLCNFDAINAARELLNARILLDISFVHYEKYPALVFSGNNMRQIHTIQAEISIDPY